MFPSAQPTKRRMRSESQLKQKRLADRTKHKENRLASKKAMERIESDIALIKRGLQGLGLQLRALNSIPAPLPTLFSSSPSITLGQLYVPTWTGFPKPSQLPPDLLQAQAATSHVLDCQCGSRHLDKFDHIDNCGVTELYKGRTALDHDADALGDMPRNPSLSAMMLQSSNDNTATFFITGLLRAYPLRSIEQQLASYFLGYRYMRVCLDPNTRDQT